jgi:hypothetical protein
MEKPGSLFCMAEMISDPSYGVGEKMGRENEYLQIIVLETLSVFFQ